MAHQADTVRQRAAAGLSTSTMARQLGIRRASVRRFLGGVSGGTDRGAVTGATDHLLIEGHR